MGILLGFLTAILIFVSLFLMLVVLAQKSKDGGMGAALGGGAAEAAFGAETNNVLSKSTIYSAILFFVLAFALYLGRIYERSHARAAAGNALPTIAAPVTPLTAPAKGPSPAATAPSTPTTGSPAVSLPVPATTSSTATSSAASAPAPANK